MKKIVEPTLKTIGWPLRVLRRAAEWIGNHWRPVHEGFLALRPIWLASLLSVAVAAAVIFVPQAQDTLVDLEGAVSVQSLSLLLAAVLLALAAWYFSRSVLYVRYSFTPVPDERFKGLRKWVPRALGALQPLALAVAGLRAEVYGLATLYAFVAAAFLAFVIYRWHIVAFLTQEPRPSKSQTEKLEKDLPPTTFRLIVSLLILVTALLIAFIWFKTGPAERLGPIGILCLAAAGWIAVGNMVLIYPSYRYQVPSLVVLGLLWAGFCSLFNDNHGVRVLERETAWKRDPVGEHLRQWAGYRASPGEEYPLVVVAAEGGGIRAAYWTASVLAQLERQIPGFSCHVFAISGVSGGSLGATVFAGLTADAIESGRRAPCDGSGGEPASSAQAVPWNATDIGHATRKVLGEDFLAPTLAGMLFPDLVQRFWPLPKPWALPDRAVYLETSWEAAWEKIRTKPGRNRMAEHFGRLWGDGDSKLAQATTMRLRREVPSLFLNGTWVGDGERAVTSNLLIPSSAEQNGGPFNDLDDVLSLGKKPIRASTAAHMSARFTYISPAGTIDTSDGKRQIVDGGYFENSGALTAREIVNLVTERCPQHCDGVSIRPILIYIQNSNEKAQSGGSDSRKPFGETLTPVVALLRTRSARGRLAEDQFEGVAQTLRPSPQEPDYFHFALGEGTEDVVPLGWALSERVRRAMDRKVEGLDAQTHKAVERLGGLIQSPGLD